ncbi:sensor domain-containing diguanylate cyclase [Steroidobacter sp.]|uniref:GGDEF domain-containing protein n=1 Tax=Steroidobacter sp. TaxID=1978227 RepID=UPI001A3F33F3|nr:GGDEF domain-containing protein [Steroidobacter sp.]MBL8271616.1 GGDEF domain-containing protein [Steroidobacter sp.]
MIRGAPLNLAAIPDSPYAAELLRGQSQLRFSPDLEAEYVRAHLIESRLIIRVMCALGAVLAVTRTVELMATGSPIGGSFLPIAFVAFVSTLLTAIAWSSTFERLFVPFARVIVPMRNVIVAACIAAAAAKGQREMLMVLPLLLLGPFFFLGMHYRTALFSGVVATLSFIAHAIIFELAMPVALRSIALVIVTLVGCAAVARHVERLSRTSFLETRLIAQLAEHDTLTGTKNRRVFDEHLARVWSQAASDGRKIALLLIDVDHFKAYNDHYGHQAGDRSLRQIAQCLQSVVRGPLDLLSRYGGEEFVALLFDVDAEQATKIADRVRQSVNELGIEHRGSRTTSMITISIGVAVVGPDPTRTPRGALQLADQALYAAKVGGRNRVRVMNETDYGMLVTGVFAQPARAAGNS